MTKSIYNLLLWLTTEREPPVPAVWDDTFVTTVLIVPADIFYGAVVTARSDAHPCGNNAASTALEIREQIHCKTVPYQADKQQTLPCVSCCLLEQETLTTFLSTGWSRKKNLMRDLNKLSSKSSYRNTHRPNFTLLLSKVRDRNIFQYKVRIKWNPLQSNLY